MDVTVVPFGMMRYASSESMFWFPLLVQRMDLFFIKIKKKKKKKTENEVYGPDVEQLFIKEENWPYVFADLFKYWIIERFGGIYFEPDGMTNQVKHTFFPYDCIALQKVILVKPIDLENMINTIGAKTGTISPDTLAEQADFEINGTLSVQFLFILSKMCASRSRHDL